MNINRELVGAFYLFTHECGPFCVRPVFPTDILFVSNYCIPSKENIKWEIWDYYREFKGKYLAH